MQLMGTISIKELSREFKDQPVRKLIATRAAGLSVAFQLQQGFSEPSLALSVSGSHDVEKKSSKQVFSSLANMQG